MNDFLLQIFSDYGLPTAMLIFMAWLFLTFTKNHREERKEWREDSMKRAETSDIRQKETNEVLRTLTGVIQEINKK